MVVSVPLCFRVVHGVVFVFHCDACDILLGDFVILHPFVSHGRIVNRVDATDHELISYVRGHRDELAAL